MSAKKDPTTFAVTENSYMRVVWAKVPENPSIAVNFSVDYIVDGIVIQTINSLCIRSTINENNERVEHIGSMSTQYRSDKTMYSNTFFPGSNRKDENGERQEERRKKFVESCTKAVQAFLEASIKKMEERKKAQTVENPLVSQFQNFKISPNRRN